MKPFPLLAAIGCATLALCLSSCKKDEATLFYLAEADGTETGAAFNVIFNGKPYERSPIFSLSQFEYFSSFMAADGSYGIVLQADTKYRSRLYSATAARQGKHILPIMNGFAFAPQVITRPINDGKVVIWNGLNGYDLQLLGNTIKPKDEEMEEKRYLEKDPRPKPKFKEIKNQGRDMYGRVIPEIPSIN